MMASDAMIHPHLTPPLKGEELSCKPYTKRTQARAVQLRRNLTPSERRLWQALRAEQLGVKFRRQQPIGPYIADFVALKAKLIVEVDGGGHSGARDQLRDAFLTREGYTVLRVWNHEVDQALEAVLVSIVQALNAKTLPLQGGGKGGGVVAPLAKETQGESL